MRATSQYEEREGEGNETDFVEIDYVELLLGDAVEESSLLGEVDNLERFEDLGEFGGSDIGVNVENLTVSSFGETGEDGERTGSDGRFDGLLVDGGDATDEAVLGFVEILGGEDSGRNRSGSRSERFEGGDESEILGEEDASGVGEGAGVGDADTYGESGVNIRKTSQGVNCAPPM